MIAAGDNPSRQDQALATVGRTAAGILVSLALAVFVGYLLIYSHYAFRLFAFPFDYDQGEGFELVDTLLFSQGEWPYRDIAAYPFYSSNYPPVFHLIAAPLVAIFGPQYWTGRLVSYLGTLLTAAAIGYAVQKAGRRWWLSALSGLAFLASNTVYQVGPLFRQHLFMVMFETLAIVLLARTVAREETTGGRANRRLLGVMALLLLAGFTKQLAYATVAAVFIFLFLRDWRRAIVWAVPFAAATAAVFFGINVATDGHWLINTINANLNPLDVGRSLALYRQWLRLHPVLTLVAALTALVQLYRERLSIYAIWFAAATANAVTAGTWGAGPSYFATAIAASCILTGIGLARLLDARPLEARPAWTALTLGAVAVLFLVQAVANAHLPTESPWLRQLASAIGLPPVTMAAPQTSCSAPRPAEAIPYVDRMGFTLVGRPPTAADAAAGREIAGLIAAAGPGPAFSEDAGFNFYLGRDVVTNPTQLLNLYNNGYGDIDVMRDMLDRQAFDSVVLRAQFYPPPILDVIGQRYETTSLVQMNGFVYCIMTPR